ncbi:MAG TPA: radical SAM protein [Bryobacteraceae bacterium]|nr:radical SAM protein [Bryobacteraceae bacterium]
MLEVYPESAAERDAFILNSRIPARRDERAELDPRRPWAFFVEEERSKDGERVPVATVFLTNRECPWRCLMCDLWKNTLAASVAAGAIPEQIDYALGRLPAARQIKLYNSGSFFDPRAIPPGDYAAIAERVRSFERVIVENHPALVGEAAVRFRDLAGRPLEIAMGLETAHPEILEKLNKRMTLDQFRRAADFLRANGIDLRVFILVKPPFMREEEAVEWAARSVDFAFDCGATAITLIPTRGGNGAMEELSFAPPRLDTLEAAFEYGLGLRRGRVFVDLWDVRSDDAARIDRLRRLNLTQ